MDHTLTSQEELILLSVGALYPEAYAYGIQQEIDQTLNKRFSLGTIHTILYRMEKLGLLKSEMGGSSNKRGGRSKRIYSLTSKGYAMVRQLQEVRQAFLARISLDQLSFYGK